MTHRKYNNPIVADWSLHNVVTERDVNRHRSRCPITWRVSAEKKTTRHIFTLVDMECVSHAYNRARHEKVSY